MMATQEVTSSRPRPFPLGSPCASDPSLPRHSSDTSQKERGSFPFAYWKTKFTTTFLTYRVSELFHTLPPSLHTFALLEHMEFPSPFRHLPTGLHRICCRRLLEEHMTVRIQGTKHLPSWCVQFVSAITLRPGRDEGF